MTSDPMRILWADDEVGFFQPHVMFLSKHGYQVTSVSKGDDAVALVKNKDFDLKSLGADGEEGGEGENQDIER